METLYNIILKKVRKTYRTEKYTTLLCKKIPYITAIGYIWVLVYLLYTKSNLILVTIVKPIIVFLLVTVFRKMINRPRPYETLQITPLFKHKKGESFPSRHTASAFIIAFVSYSIFPSIGIFLIGIASIVAITRIVAGVHYISDVLVAVLIAFIIWIL